ncbi:hypothetical protein [Mycobacterium kansasii]|uniref:hypothetical protein n=1 Tax=Mycobacterium kansasii TaxID=1768 RepID=UPI003A83F2FD
MPANRLTTQQRQQLGSIGGHTSWGRTENRTARTAPARQALEDKFLAEAGGDPLRAESLRKAHYKRMALKSAQSRRREAAVAERLAVLDGGA